MPVMVLTFSDIKGQRVVLRLYRGEKGKQKVDTIFLRMVVNSLSTWGYLEKETFAISKMSS